MDRGTQVQTCRRISNTDAVRSFLDAIYTGVIVRIDLKVIAHIFISIKLHTNFDSRYKESRLAHPKGSHSIQYCASFVERRYLIKSSAPLRALSYSYPPTFQPSFQLALPACENHSATSVLWARLKCHSFATSGSLSVERSVVCSWRFTLFFEGLRPYESTQVIHYQHDVESPGSSAPWLDGSEPVSP